MGLEDIKQLNSFTKGDSAIFDLKNYFRKLLEDTDK